MTFPLFFLFFLRRQGLYFFMPGGAFCEYGLSMSCLLGIFSLYLQDYISLSVKENPVNYTVEDISPVRKRVNVTIDKEEINVALTTQVALFASRGLQLPGFRKGKAPATAIEQRFHKEIYTQAKQDLITAHINQVLQETKAEPLSGLDFGTSADAPFVRNQDYSYTMEYDLLPEFELPNYEGVSLVVEKQHDDIEDIYTTELAQLQRGFRQVVEVKEKRAPQVGDLVTIDFSFSEDGKSIHGVKANKDVQVTYFPNQLLPEIFELLKTMTTGEEKDCQVVFPEKFVDTNLAGKSALAHVKLKKIEEAHLPALNDEFAKQCGEQVFHVKIDSMQALRELLTKGIERTCQNVHKDEIQSKLLEKILENVEFPLPPGLLKMNVESSIEGLENALAKRGLSLKSIAPTREEVEAQVLPQAKYLTAAHIFLLCVAKKEGLQATELEIDQRIMQEAKRIGVQFQLLRNHYSLNGAIFTVRDQVLVDKATQLIYERANVKEVEKLEKMSENPQQTEAAPQTEGSEGPAAAEAFDTANAQGEGEGAQA